MPDITMCKGEGCPKKDTCHRHTATPNPRKQSWFGWPPIRGQDDCSYYLPNNEAAKEQAIQEANPVLKDPTFDAQCDRWTLLQQEADAMGLTGDEAAKYIASVMTRCASGK